MSSGLQTVGFLEKLFLNFQILSSYKGPMIPQREGVGRIKSVKVIKRNKILPITRL